MKTGWATKLISEVIVRSGTIDPRKAPEEPFQYVDVSSISNQTFEIVETSEMLGKDAPSRARRHIQAGDVLFATIRPTLRRIAVVPEALDGQVCSTGYFVFRTKPAVDGRFLFYYLFSDAFMGAMEALQTGASYPAVNDSQVKQQQITFPPLPEQKRIVAILDEAFAGIDAAVANTEKNLANARELFESYLNAVFTQKGDGWVEKQLVDVVSSSCSLSYGIVQPGNEFDAGLPVVRPTDLKQKIIQISGLKRINPQLAESYKRTTLSGGELLLCVRGSTGIISIASEELAGANVTRGIVPIRFDPSAICRDFGFYMLISAAVQNQIKEGTYGAALMQINIRDLKNILVPYPQLTDQKKLLNGLNSFAADTQRLEAIYQQKLEAFAELKQSILQKAFAGELTALPETTVAEASA